MVRGLWAAESSRGQKKSSLVNRTQRAAPAGAAVLCFGCTTQRACISDPCRCMAGTRQLVLASHFSSQPCPQLTPTGALPIIISFLGRGRPKRKKKKVIRCVYVAWRLGSSLFFFVSTAARASARSRAAGCYCETCATIPVVRWLPLMKHRLVSRPSGRASSVSAMRGPVRDCVGHPLGVKRWKGAKVCARASAESG